MVSLWIFGLAPCIWFSLEYGYEKYFKKQKKQTNKKVIA